MQAQVMLYMKLTQTTGPTIQWQKPKRRKNSTSKPGKRRPQTPKLKKKNSQRNTVQMKEQHRNTQVQINKEEI